MARFVSRRAGGGWCGTDAVKNEPGGPAIGRGECLFVGEPMGRDEKSGTRFGAGKAMEDAALCGLFGYLRWFIGLVRRQMGARLETGIGLVAMVGWVRIQVRFYLHRQAGTFGW